ncbi:MAG: SDR family NAD(P)-dependent oxidoreductase [Acidimicrobiales bacterium]
MINLAEKTALVTGAANPTGIGHGIASNLAGLGANVVLTDVSSDDLNARASQLSDEHGVDVMALRLDVTDPNSIAEAMTQVERRFGGLDALFNNAAAVFGAPTPIHEYDEADWLRTLDVSLNGAIRVTQAAVPLMAGRRGAIVNVSSRAGKKPAELNGAYSVAKAGIIMATKVMAIELAPKGIRVNAICPGFIDTDLQVLNVALKAYVMDVTEEQARQLLVDSVPLGRMGTVAEVADLCAYLVSEQSSYVTGQAINIGGGLLTEL